MTKRQAIICDLDGTLCNHSRRQLLLPKDPNQPDAQECWDKYHADLYNDPVIEATRLILDLVDRVPHESFHGSLQDIIIITGRPQKYLESTQNWMAKNSIRCDKLYMRGDGDRRPDFALKKGIYMNTIEPHYDIQFVIDDRDSVVKMWRDLGLTCFQTCEGNY